VHPVGEFVPISIEEPYTLGQTRLSQTYEDGKKFLWIFDKHIFCSVAFYKISVIVKSISQGSIFPKISNQKLNSYLKEIADVCRIKKNLTFHIVETPDIVYHPRRVKVTIAGRTKVTHPGRAKVDHF